MKRMKRRNEYSDQHEHLKQIHTAKNESGMIFTKSWLAGMRARTT